MVSRHLTLLHEFIVFTDDEADYPEPIIKLELPHEGLQGWWNKIALFKPGLFADGDRVLYLDLDTLIVGCIDAIASYDGEHGRLGPFFADVLPPFNGLQSGVMAWRGGFGVEVWKAYELTGLPQNLRGGDQYFLNRISPKADVLTELFPGKIVSFRMNGGVPSDEAAILCFHGQPRIHQVFPQGWEEARVEVSTGMKRLGGFWWPVEDRDCWRATLASSGEHVTTALRYTRGRDVCVQAGGNVGVFPLRLAAHFADVRTFEPDHRNYACMEKNLRGHAVNLVAWCAALGDDNTFVDVVATAANAGQSRIGGDGEVPMMRIDDLDLEACDLIYLDIEGYEMKALRGAVETVRRFRPTIIVEDNGLSEHYGTAIGETPAWVCQEFNYRIAAEIGRDVILVPGEWRQFS